MKNGEGLENGVSLQGLVKDIFVDCQSSACNVPCQLPYQYRVGSLASAPLFVLLHGRGGDMDVMKIFLRQLPIVSTVLMPQAPLVDAEGGFCWWPSGAARISPLRPECRHAADLVSKLVKHFVKDKQIAPQKVMGIGFSQGGVLLSIVAQQDRSIFDRLALLASFVYVDTDVDSTAGFVGEQLPDVLQIHGAADEIITLKDAKQAAEKLMERGFKVTFIQEEGIGHRTGVRGMSVLKEWTHS